MALDIEQIYRRFGPMVLRRCRALLVDDHQAIDALQDVFVRLISEAPRLDDRALSSLLYRIATNVSLNKLRARRRRPETPDDDLLAAIAHAVDLEHATHERTLVQRLFKNTRNDTAAMAVMHWVDGMTLDEVSAETGMSVSGVRKRLASLRSALDGEKS